MQCCDGNYGFREKFTNIRMLNCHILSQRQVSSRSYYTFQSSVSLSLFTFPSVRQGCLSTSRPSDLHLGDVLPQRWHWKHGRQRLNDDHDNDDTKVTHSGSSAFSHATWNTTKETEGTCERCKEMWTLSKQRRSLQLVPVVFNDMKKRQEFICVTLHGNHHQFSRGQVFILIHYVSCLDQRFTFITSYLSFTFCFKLLEVSTVWNVSPQISTQNTCFSAYNTGIFFQGPLSWQSSARDKKFSKKKFFWHSVSQDRISDQDFCSSRHHTVGN